MDLKALAEFVRPAYTAMNFAVLCTRGNPSFLADNSGAHGTVLHYAERVKNEAIKSLTGQEASTVLKMAADDARRTAREKLHQLARPGDEPGTDKAIRSWCDSEARQYVMEFIRRQDTEGSDRAKQ
jgi:hypothetical protein